MVTLLRKNEPGVALLAVLLGIAMMTLVVMDFALTAGLGFVSAANQANEMRAGYLARSGIAVGLGALAADARTKAQDPTQNPVEALTDAWATPIPPVQVGGGTVSVSIVDEARKLSINSMVVNGIPQPAAIQKMQRLFTILDVNVDLVQGIVDWITPNGGNAPGGGAGDYYLGLKPPYQPRYGAMPTIADLQLVEGFNEAIFNRVSPFLTVMSETAVNANTASPQVIAALEPELMEDQKTVQEIIQARAIRPFANTTDIQNLPGLGETVAQALSKDVQTRSQFFTIIATGTFAGARKIITATFHRETTGVGTMAAWHED